MGPLHRLLTEAINHATCAHKPKHFLAHPRFIIDCYEEAVGISGGPLATTGTPTICGYELDPDDAVPYGELVEVL